MVVGPIALAYNVAGVDGLRLAPDTIARHLQPARSPPGTSPEIRRDNPDISLAGNTYPYGASLG